MSVNDILVQGAEPLFFLDYFVCERLDVPVATDVIKGIAAGCETAGCALIGGETAEHPNAFIPGEYDLAGFAVGVVEKSLAIDGSLIREGDVLIGLASSGFHSNGFSLVRKIIDLTGTDINAPFSTIYPATKDTRKLGELLLAPTRIYVKPVLSLLKAIDVHGMAHITGGGLTENTHRMFPYGLCAQIRTDSWSPPELFGWAAQAGKINGAEMARTFNCGIGFVVVVSSSDASATLEHFARCGEDARVIGGVVRCEGEPAHTVIL
jgi:phosphoribosylformylglycinamidine cyclo-ligase